MMIEQNLFYVRSHSLIEKDVLVLLKSTPHAITVEIVHYIFYIYLTALFKDTFFGDATLTKKYLNKNFHLF